MGNIMEYSIIHIKKKYVKTMASFVSVLHHSCLDQNSADDLLLLQLLGKRFTPYLPINLHHFQQVSNANVKVAL